MAELGGQLEGGTPRDRAKALILKRLTVKRVAGWCGVGEMAVYQWLQRATDEQPFPADRVPVVIEGARRDGLDAPLEVLWPAMSAALARLAA